MSWILLWQVFHMHILTSNFSTTFLGNVIRVWLLLFTPLALSAMFQLTISGGTTMMAIAATSLIVLTVGTSVFLTWRILRAASGDAHLEDFGLLLKYGALYNTLAEEGT